MMLENIDFDLSECTSRISTTFSLNSAGRSPASRLTEQRQRSVQRRLHIAPLRMDNKFLGSPGKENLPTEEELSFYHGNSPQASPRPCSPCDCPEDTTELLPSEVTPNKQTIISATLLEGTGPGSANRLRRPLEDYDPNSMDSGYGASVSSEGHKSQSLFRFIQPSAPRQNSTAVSPAANPMRIFHSLSSGSMESMDDIDMELFEMDTLDDNAQLPSNLNSLICGDIKATKTTPEAKRPFFRRCLSLSENPIARRAKSNLIFGSPVASSYQSPAKTPERLRATPDKENLSITPFASRPDPTRCFKRPEPPGISPIQSKRHKTEVLTPVSSLRTVEPSPRDSPSLLTVPSKRPILQKSISMNDAHIMSALSRSSTEPDLIGDFSKSYVLPLIEGRHRDLKSITPTIMAELLRGTFDHQIASFKIIDCRYPYEFEGGHIRGAKNLYTQEQILEELIKSKTEPPTVAESSVAEAPLKRHIIVFHCEFSSERGPKLSRFLRNHDRILNSDSYPALHYPEIYLLHGGYKDFFALHPDLCDPVAYRPMLDPLFGDAYRHFRSKSRSWNGGDVVRGSAMAGPGPSGSGGLGGGGGGGGGGTRLVKSRSRLVL
ncbi:M-phase inducer phosphatase [Aedes aegypti]|uniref:protein-tyrosine-phosphatase n=1 Tax=Aedes aegypti TaxID=7159 RepID=A0A6I8TPU6_AEDAE|nr:M-phase inducer phosphatase [Aedes aegypti]